MEPTQPCCKGRQLCPLPCFPDRTEFGLGAQEAWGLSGSCCLSLRISSACLPPLCPSSILYLTSCRKIVFEYEPWVSCVCVYKHVCMCQGKGLTERQLNC